jgi:hypothetical protein
MEKLIKLLENYKKSYLDDLVSYGEESHYDLSKTIIEDFIEYIKEEL